MNFVRKLDAGQALIPAAFIALTLAVFAPKGLVVLFSLTALLSLAALYYQDRLSEIARGWAAPLLVLVVVWASLSYFWALEPGKVAGRAVQLAGLWFAALVTTAACRKLKHKEPALEKALVVGLAAGGAFLAWELITDGTISIFARELLGQENTWRSFNLNGATAFFLILVWPALFLLRTKRAIFFAFLGLTLVITALSVSTTALVAIASGVMVFIVSYVFGARAIGLVAVFVVLLVFSMPLMSTHIIAPDRIEEMAPDMKRSGLHRLIMWEFASHRIAEKPLTGWGLGASRAIPGGNQIIPKAGARNLYYTRNLTLHPHNWAIQAWLELGLPGAALLATLAGLTLWSTARNFHHRAARAAGAASAMTAMVFALSSWSLWQAWWISALALCAALAASALRSGEDSPP